MSAAHEFMNRRAVQIQTPGRYSLASRFDATGARREFACRTSRISPFQMLVAAPVTGPEGERVIAHFGEFGKLDGLISDVVDGGFLVDLVISQGEREKLTNKLEWLDKRTRDPSVVDVRKQQRIVPKNPHTTLLFADETALTCFVIDVSPSGVAISADVEPDIGTRLAVGRTVGSVVRRFDEGFAVRFDQLQDPSQLELLVRPTTALAAAAAMRYSESSWYLD
ncbi:MAG: hypothetical protein QOG38_1805 [Hyphomicrobiales bacterium]|nr:hypothetical protein [Hyphomicrobiales bacterium]